MQQTVTGMQGLARNRDVALMVEGDAGDMRADPVHLGLALRNVVENAINAAPAGSAVTVALSMRGIEVRDQGPGIDPGDLPHVTDRFYTGKNGKGTGLGLAIADAALGRIGWALGFRRARPLGQLACLTAPRDATPPGS